MNNQYMIPANSKKSQLILGFFTPIDLAIFASGAGLTLLLLLVFSQPSVAQIIIMLLPVLVTGFLVLPVPHYHNILQLITNLFNFYLGRRRYYWKGWCLRDESKTE